MVEALTPCTKQPQKQDVRFRQTTAAMLEVLTYTPSIAEPRIGARRQATQEHHAMDTLKKRGGNRRSGENSPPAQTQQSVILQK